MSLAEQRRLEEKERRREEIIDAAEAVIAEKGYEAARMEEIARAARVSRALVYTYFRDKTELHFAICHRALQLLRERFEQAIAAHPRGIDQVAAIGRTYVEFAREFPTRFAALSRFEAHRPPESSASDTELAVLGAGQCAHAVTVQALQNGMRDGSVRTDLDPMLIALSLWGFCHGVLQQALTKPTVFAQAGIEIDPFIHHSLALALRALAP